MASTFSNLGLELQATGENANTWGDKTNTNLSMIDERLSEIHTISSTSTSQTISAPSDGTSGETTRYATLKYTGSASSAITVTLPSSVKIVYNVINGTGQDITFQCSTTTTTAKIKNGQSGIIHSDGSANVYLISTVANDFEDDVTVKTGDGALLTLQTSSTSVTDGNILGALQFQAPNEASGTDAITVAASIVAEADSAFDAATNQTDMVFKLGSSGVATEKMRLTHEGDLTVSTSFTIGSATITEAELEILDGATVTTAELNILDGVTATASELNIMDGVTATTAELNIMDGVTSTASELNLLDGSSAGTVVASKAVVVDSNKDISGFRNISNTGTITTGGAITASGDITAFSDERLKSDIKTIDNALNKVMNMRGVSYTKQAEKGIGVIAQEIEKILPEVVSDGEYKSVAYGNMVGVLIEAIKELKSELDNHKQGCKCHDATK